jgi:hypothetical protein
MAKTYADQRFASLVDILDKALELQYPRKILPSRVLGAGDKPAVGILKGTREHSFEYRIDSALEVAAGQKPNVEFVVPAVALHQLDRSFVCF